MIQSILDSWAKISPHLDEVLDLEPVKRDAWLADLDTRAPQLVATLRAHLAELTELKARKFMDVTIPARIASTIQNGQRFGAYTIESAIGHGGMGTVWLAHRSDGQFEGHAAVKLLHAALVGHPSERRLAREGRVLAKLQHPNIAHLLDAGVGANDQPYLILEYVRGEPVDRYCETRKLGIRQRIELFLDVLGAVAHAHGHLIVHRDLKPSNILVTAEGVVKLLDFGIAALLSPTAQNNADLTQQPAPCLTPGYAAPEQLLGEPVTVGTDVYALGALLFVLLTGRHPSLACGNTKADWMRAVLGGEAPRMSEVAPGIRERRKLRGDLDSIVAMALRRLPAERYRTVEQFAQDLRRYLALEPVSARPRSLSYIMRKFARRHRVAVAAAAVSAVVIAAAMVITTQQMLDARYQRDQARYQSRRAEASIDFLTQLMRWDAWPDVPARNFHKRLDLGVEMLKRQYQDDPQFAGRMLVDLADYYRNDGETTRANQLYAQAYELGKQHSDTELIVSAQCSRADGDAYAGIHEGTQQRIQEARQLLNKMRNPDVALDIQCRLAQVSLKKSLGEYDAAEALMRSAMAKREAVDGTSESLSYASLLTELGSIDHARGKPREALQAVQTAAEIFDRNGRGRMAAGLNSRYAIASLLTDMGEIRRALDEREAIELRLRETGGSINEHVAFPISHALLLLRMGNVADARQALDGVVERARQAGNPVFLSWALLSDASTYIALRQWDEAQARLAAVSTLLAGGDGDRNIRVLAETIAAEMALARTDLVTARRHRGNALELAGYETDDPQRGLPRALLVAAKIALADVAAGDAERFAAEALRLSELKARGQDTSADVGESLLRIAEARLLTHRTADVRAILERAAKCLGNALDVNHPLAVEARTLLAGLPSAR